MTQRAIKGEAFTGGERLSTHPGVKLGTVSAVASTGSTISKLHKLLTGMRVVIGATLSADTIAACAFLVELADRFYRWIWCKVSWCVVSDRIVVI